MKSINLILFGLNVSEKVIFKYNGLYKQKSIIEPFNFSCMMRGKKYYSYQILNEKIKNYENIHLHSFSGSCHFLLNFLELYPENIEKIKSQIYDSPCHINGASNFLKENHCIPNSISNILINTCFDDCKRSSDIFLEKPLIKNIPTGIIYSSADIISPQKHIDTMIEKWGEDCQITLLETDSKHIESFKDYPEKYTSFCRNIQSKVIQ